jgi:hypothetical protein
VGLTWLALLVIPAGHHIRSHRLHVRLVRAIWPGPAVPLTEHERKHAARPVHIQMTADLAWLTFIALVVVLAMVTFR